MHMNETHRSIPSHFPTGKFLYDIDMLRTVPSSRPTK